MLLELLVGLLRQLNLMRLLVVRLLVGLLVRLLMVLLVLLVRLWYVMCQSRNNL
jgi:hypothetical protein